MRELVVYIDESGNADQRHREWIRLESEHAPLISSGARRRSRRALGGAVLPPVEDPRRVLEEVGFVPLKHEKALPNPVVAVLLKHGMFLLAFFVAQLLAVGRFFEPASGDDFRALGFASSESPPR